MYTSRLFLQPIFRASLTSIKSVPHLRLSHISLCGNGAVRTWQNVIKLNVLYRNVPSPYWKLLVRKYHHFPHGIFHRSGGKLAVYTIVGLSAVVGSTRGWPRVAYCTDGFESLADDRDFSVPDNLDADEERYALANALRKFLLPFFCLLTVLVNWGQPIVIAAKVILILYSTKPSPFSVYLVVEQFRHEAMRRHPIIYKYMPCYAKKFEVEDYVFLCIARVELDNQNLTLLGILGSWWVWPLPSWL